MNRVTIEFKEDDIKHKDIVEEIISIIQKNNISLQDSINIFGSFVVSFVALVATKETIDNEIKNITKAIELACYELLNNDPTK